jgi:hypothetical protein
VADYTPEQQEFIDQLNRLEQVRKHMLQQQLIRLLKYRRIQLNLADEKWCLARKEAMLKALERDQAKEARVFKYAVLDQAFRLVISAFLVGMLVGRLDLPWPLQIILLAMNAFGMIRLLEYEFKNKVRSIREEAQGG